MSPRATNQRIAKAFYTSFEVNNLFSLLKKLGFYLDDTTANDFDWVFKHKYRTPKNGKGYIRPRRYGRGKALRDTQGSPTIFP